MHDEVQAADLSAPVVAISSMRLRNPSEASSALAASPAKAVSSPRVARSRGGRSVGCAATAVAMTGSNRSPTTTDSLVGKSRKKVMWETPAAAAICATEVCA
jgi:hypothetical protein